MQRSVNAGVVKSRLPLSVGGVSNGFGDIRQAAVFARIVHAIADYKIADTGEAGEAGGGDRILAALIDGETTLKRYLVEAGQPYLKAENPAYPNLIPAAELAVQGVMIGLLRRFS